MGFLTRAKQTPLSGFLCGGSSRWTSRMLTLMGLVPQAVATILTMMCLDAFSSSSVSSCSCFPPVWKNNQKVVACRSKRGSAFADKLSSCHPVCGSGTVQLQGVCRWHGGRCKACRSLSNHQGTCQYATRPEHFPPIQQFEWGVEPGATHHTNFMLRFS